jgi:hypothetical protein
MRERVTAAIILLEDSVRKVVLQVLQGILAVVMHAKHSSIPYFIRHTRGGRTCFFLLLFFFVDSPNREETLDGEHACYLRNVYHLLQPGLNRIHHIFSVTLSTSGIMLIWKLW